MQPLNDLCGKLEYLTVRPMQWCSLRSSLAFMNSNVGERQVRNERQHFCCPVWKCRALCQASLSEEELTVCIHDGYHCHDRVTIADLLVSLVRYF